MTDLIERPDSDVVPAKGAKGKRRAAPPRKELPPDAVVPYLPPTPTTPGWRLSGTCTVCSNQVFPGRMDRRSVLSLTIPSCSS